MLKKRKIWLLVLTLSLPTGAAVLWNLHHCDNQCAHASIESLKWRTWLAGSSGSNQFHYVDLLELLYRTTHKDTDNANSPMEQR
ncbi:MULTISPECIES: hypothetical protein [Ferrimonas]|uniref:hypothetical protein n=1 Tax=Ferrimonas TaxID=44011 RepID=UPI00042304C0|nr:MULTISPECIES: hypothetical protein [Ferrimonas]USD37896.1 hypothetical protein J8Z22_01615 [Ferrimonas sp. SCSIO 43195]